jgi:bis(5'-nucleosidyl)-tetraphosphatase
MRKMKGKYRRAVFIVIYSRDKKDRKKIQYLILHRKHHWRGWEFSKGGIEPFELKRHAARREAGEESGLKILKLKRFSYSGKYKYNKKLADRRGKIGQTFWLFGAEARIGKVKLDKKEHSGFKWMSYEQAMKRLTWPDQKKGLKIVNSWLNKIR